MGKEILAGISAFVEGRRKEEGGYGATPLLPATVEDTYHALRIFDILCRIRGMRKIVAPGRHEGSLERYIAKAAETPWVSARTTFQVLYCASSVGLALDLPKATGYISRRLTTKAHLAERYYCARVLREILVVRDMAVWRKARIVRFSKWRTARELWMKLYLQDGVSSLNSTRRNRMVQWLQACQNGDGGFGFFPGTTSYIENCHTCARALVLFHAEPLNLEGCLHFVLACRTGNGGFARNPGAAPFLDATWHAVAVMNLLKGWRKVFGKGCFR